MNVYIITIQWPTGEFEDFWYTTSNEWEALKSVSMAFIKACSTDAKFINIRMEPLLGSETNYNRISNPDGV